MPSRKRKGAWARHLPPDFQVGGYQYPPWVKPIFRGGGGPFPEESDDDDENSSSYSGASDDDDKYLGLFLDPFKSICPSYQSICLPS